MLALLSPLFGIIGSLLPSVVRLFEKKQDQKHELELRKLDIEAAKAGYEANLAVENVKADVAEGQSLRAHDSELDGGVVINTLRASIRPVVTYIFFGLFVAIKITAGFAMYHIGADVPAILKAIWDTETMSLFSTIIAFWFGLRTLEKMDQIILSNNTPTPTLTKSKVK